MIVPFNPHDSTEFYEEYYSRQAGNGLSVYAGRRIMDGDGLGSFLGGVMKKMAPTLKGLAKSAAKTVGKQALNVMHDVVDGKDFRSSAARGLKNAGGEMMEDVFKAVSGRKRKHTSRQKSGKRRRITRKNVPGI
jgi:hypothetical protein